MEDLFSDDDNMAATLLQMQAEQKRAENSTLSQHSTPPDSPPSSAPSLPPMEPYDLAAPVHIRGNTNMEDPRSHRRNEEKRTTAEPQYVEVRQQSDKRHVHRDDGQRPSLAMETPDARDSCRLDESAIECEEDDDLSDSNHLMDSIGSPMLGASHNERRLSQDSEAEALGEGRSEGDEFVGYDDDHNAGEIEGYDDDAYRDDGASPSTADFNSCARFQKLSGLGSANENSWEGSASKKTPKSSSSWKKDVASIGKKDDSRLGKQEGAPIPRLGKQEVSSLSRKEAPSMLPNSGKVEEKVRLFDPSRGQSTQAEYNQHKDFASGKSSSSADRRADHSNVQSSSSKESKKSISKTSKGQAVDRKEERNNPHEQGKNGDTQECMASSPQQAFEGSTSSRRKTPKESGKESDKKPVVDRVREFMQEKIDAIQKLRAIVDIQNQKLDVAIAKAEEMHHIERNFDEEHNITEKIEHVRKQYEPQWVPGYFAKPAVPAEHKQPSGAGLLGHFQDIRGFAEKALSIGARQSRLLNGGAFGGTFGAGVTGTFGPTAGTVGYEESSTRPVAKTGVSQEAVPVLASLAMNSTAKMQRGIIQLANQPLLAIQPSPVVSGSPGVTPSTPSMPGLNPGFQAFKNGMAQRGVAQNGMMQNGLTRPTMLQSGLAGMSVPSLQMPQMPLVSQDNLMTSNQSGGKTGLSPQDQAIMMQQQPPIEGLNRAAVSNASRVDSALADRFSLPPRPAADKRASSQDMLGRSKASVFGSKSSKASTASGQNEGSAPSNPAPVNPTGVGSCFRGGMYSPYRKNESRTTTSTKTSTNEVTLPPRPPSLGSKTVDAGKAQSKDTPSHSSGSADNIHENPAINKINSVPVRRRSLTPTGRVPGGFTTPIQRIENPHATGATGPRLNSIQLGSNVSPISVCSSAGRAINGTYGPASNGTGGGSSGIDHSPSLQEKMLHYMARKAEAENAGASYDTKTRSRSSCPLPHQGNSSYYANATAYSNSTTYAGAYNTNTATYTMNVNSHRSNASSHHSNMSNNPSNMSNYQSNLSGHPSLNRPMIVPTGSGSRRSSRGPASNEGSNSATVPNSYYTRDSSQGVPNNYVRDSNDASDAVGKFASDKYNIKGLEHTTEYSEAWINQRKKIKELIRQTTSAVSGEA